MEATLENVQEALTRERITAFFQPIVDLRTGTLCGFELLARWVHPVVGPTLPPDFVRIAEEHGLSGLLLQQVLRSALQNAALLPHGRFLAANVSPKDLCGVGLVDIIRSEIARANFDPHRLILEITEAVPVEDLGKAQIVSSELVTMGCRLELDDFGTGYSSLSSLQELPFYGLKIDKRFIETMVTRRQSRKIVASILNLAVSLDMKSVAEGVESEEQADLLLWLGCNMAQGWLFGAAVPASGLLSAVAEKYRAADLGFQIDDDAHLSPLQRLAHLRALYKGAPIGLCFLDRRLRFVSLNERYARDAGRERSDFLGATVEEMYPDLYPRLRPLLERALKGESVKDEQTRRPAKERGSADKVLVSYEPVRDELDEIVGISVAVLNLSHRWTMGQSPALLNPDEQEDVLAAPTEMSWRRDARGNLRDVDPRWTELAGLTKEQALDLGWLEAVYPDDRANALKALREALVSRGVFDVTYRLRTKDGELRWMRTRGYPQHDHQGRFTGWYGGVEDLSEKRSLYQLSSFSQ